MGDYAGLPGNQQFIWQMHGRTEADFRCGHGRFLNLMLAMYLNYADLEWTI